jgi:adenosyl cobinamide kinase/adenosyl cobinamide phosphate guanylyltransferase
LKTPPGLTLLLGGARSGKSELAVQLATSSGGDVTFVATAEPDGDDDLAARIARHREDRPTTWTIVEAPCTLADAVRNADPSHLVLIDCVSVWVSNLMRDGLDERGAIPLADDLADALLARVPPTIVVTNEVGMGVHPSTALGRVYRDVLGRVNSRLSQRATRVCLVVAGRVLSLSPPQDVFP